MKRPTTPRVLHVLPHPGGGGETYVDYLSKMEGYNFDRLYVGAGPRPRPSLLFGALQAQTTAYRFDLIHAHGEVAAGLCMPTLARRPSVATMHGLHLVRRLEGWNRAIAEINLRLVTRSASATICVSETEFAEVRGVVGDSARVVLIRNGVDPISVPTEDERTLARIELGLRSSDLVGVYLAGLDPHKEPLIAARAAQAASANGVPLVLLFVGDGPLRTELEALAEESPRTVRVLGFRRDKRQILASADFAVLPSRREGLSFGLLETMSAGLPLVVSDAPGNREAVDSAGLVVPSGDIAMFAAAFEILARDERERVGLGERAKQRAALFRSREMIDRTREVYNRVCMTAR